jgi:hypothetical protein
MLIGIFDTIIKSCLALETINLNVSPVEVDYIVPIHIESFSSRLCLITPKHNINQLHGRIFLNNECVISYIIKECPDLQSIVLRNDISSVRNYSRREVTQAEINPTIARNLLKYVLNIPSHKVNCSYFQSHLIPDIMELTFLSSEMAHQQCYTIIEYTSDCSPGLLRWGYAENNMVSADKMHGQLSKGGYLRITYYTQPSPNRGQAQTL